MKKHAFLLVLCLLAGCAVPAQSTPPAAVISPTSTPTPSLTPSPTFTSTPSPTSTPTVTPTIVGGSEPKIAFIAKDSQGNINLYMDGLFTGQPKIITKMLLPEAEAPVQMKWSSDGRKLAFTNQDENQELWVFVYDVMEDNFQKLYKVPSGRYVSNYKWSPDDDVIILETVNARCCTPAWANFQISLSDGIIEQVQRESFSLSSITRVNNQATCARNSTIRFLQSAGYRETCYFPEIGLYGGLKYQSDSADYDLLSEDGQVQKTLFRFPTNFGTNGYMDLLLSPDKSRVLMIGETLRLLGSDTERGIPFVIPVSLTDSTTETMDPETLYYNEPVFEATPPPHILFTRYVLGWSPDSRSYVEARFYFDGWNRIDFTAQGEYVVIDADSGNVMFTYGFQNDLLPLTTPYGSGFDLVWTSHP